MLSTAQVREDIHQVHRKVKYLFLWIRNFSRSLEVVRNVRKVCIRFQELF